MAFRRFLFATSGAAAVETALILPAIAFVALNVIDLGRYIWTKMQVDLAAHEAVGAARVLCDTAAELPAKTNCGGTLYNTMQSATQSTSLGSTVSIGASIAAVNEAWYCANAAGDLTQVAALGGTVPANCSATLTGSTSKPGDYISATATHNFSPIFPGASVGSLLPATITRTAWLRLQ